MTIAATEFVSWTVVLADTKAGKESQKNGKKARGERRECESERDMYIE